MKRIHVIDSHTGGEPTRVVLAGGPDLGSGTLPERLARFREAHDAFRAAIVNEPRGSDVLVGALLLEPSDPTCAAAVIFFNNVGYLGMCGHGTIGLIVTLAHLGRLGPGGHRLETCVGVVTATLHDDGSVSVANVPSHRRHKAVAIDVEGVGRITGDVAWGGNWFYLVDALHLPDLPALATATSAGVEALTDLAWKVRQAVNAQGYPEIDHIEILLPPRHGGDARNFVLCPGKAYDRSPCGTGTSAKLACLAADGKLAENDPWVQESIIGSTFTARYRWIDRERGTIAPVITGRAHVMAEATLILHDDDPFRWGIPSRP